MRTRGEMVAAIVSLVVAVVATVALVALVAYVWALAQVGALVVALMIGG